MFSYISQSVVICTVFLCCLIQTKFLSLSVFKWEMSYFSNETIFFLLLVNSSSLLPENKDLVCACASPIPWLTNPPLQARALRFFMPDKSSTTMSGTRYECSAAVKTSNSLWMTTWPKVFLSSTIYLLFYNSHGAVFIYFLFHFYLSSQ